MHRIQSPLSLCCHFLSRANRIRQMLKEQTRNGKVKGVLGQVGVHTIRKSLSFFSLLWLQAG
jgi:hypothetical protein